MKKQKTPEEKAYAIIKKNLPKAVAVLVSLLDSKNKTVRLQATNSLLYHLPKLPKKYWPKRKNNST